MRKLLLIIAASVTLAGITPAANAAAAKQPTKAGARAAFTAKLAGLAGGAPVRTNRVGRRRVDTFSGAPYRHAWGVIFKRCGRRGSHWCVTPVQGNVYWQGPGAGLTVEAVHEYDAHLCGAGDGCPTSSIVAAASGAKW